MKYLNKRKFLRGIKRLHPGSQLLLHIDNYQGWMQMDNYNFRDSPVGNIIFDSQSKSFSCALLDILMSFHLLVH